MKIAFITASDPLDKRSWSGIYYRMLEALKYQFEEVAPLGPIRLPIIEFVLKGFQFLFSKITGKKYNRSHSIVLSKAYAFVLTRRLKNRNFDAIFAPTSSTLIAYLKTDIPIYYFSDATVNAMIGYYENFSNWSKCSINESNLIEKRAIMNSKASVFASDWAANSAKIFYGAIPEKVHVIKMGANIDGVPNEIKLEQKLSQKSCNLLFLGVDWKRKGGDIAFEAFELLINEGFDASLVVCGCVPPIEHPKMKVYPFLNKNMAADYAIFTQLLDEAHFLFLPTRAECAGIVFCEAAANGIPSVTTDTGGVSSYVENNVTGFVLPFSASAIEYAEVIKTTFRDKNFYKRIAEQARKRYFEELNWDVWAKQMKSIISKN